MAKARAGINLEEAGPDIELQGKGPWTIWAWINAADDHGIQISGVKSGDKLKIELISGIGYFAGASGWWRALSIAIEVGKTVINPTTNLASKIAAKGLEGVNKVVPKDDLLDECFNVVERIALVPPETVKLNLAIATQGLEMMGLRKALALNAELSAMAHVSKREEFNKRLEDARKEGGLRAFLQVRDTPFMPEPFGPRAKGD